MARQSIYSRSSFPGEGRGPASGRPQLDPGLRRGREKGKTRREGGFTLIEMMVALAVFSLAAMALIRLEGATIRSTGILDETLVAQMVARNVAVETMTDPQPPAIGPTSGSERNGGRSWTWVRQTQPLGDAGAFRVDIAVAENGGAPIGHLTIVRPPAGGGA